MPEEAVRDPVRRGQHRARGRRRDRSSRSAAMVQLRRAGRRGARAATASSARSSTRARRRRSTRTRSSRASRTPGGSSSSTRPTRAAASPSDIVALVAQEALRRPQGAAADGHAAAHAGAVQPDPRGRLRPDAGRRSPTRSARPPGATAARAHEHREAGHAQVGPVDDGGAGHRVARRGGRRDRASATRSPRSRRRRSTASVESPAAGVLRRRVAGEGDVDPGRRPARRDRRRERLRRRHRRVRGRVPGELRARRGRGGGAARAPETVTRRRRHAALPRARARAASRSCCCTASAATSTTGCSTSRRSAASAPSTRSTCPGHGGSTKEVGDGDLAALAGAVRELPRQPGDRAGRTSSATRWAAWWPASWRSSDPTRVASLTLVAPAGLGERDRRASTSRGSSPPSGRRDLKPVLQRLFADPSLVTRQMVDDVLKYKRLDGVQAALRDAAPTSLFADGRQQRRRWRRARRVLAGRCSSIWGEQDQVIPAAHAEAAPARRARRRCCRAPATRRTWRRRARSTALIEGFLAGARAG